MSILFYLFSSLPALSINFGFGNIPFRYLYLFFLSSLKIKRTEYVLLILPFFILTYPLLVINMRDFSLLDLSYFINSLYLILGITIVRNNLILFKRFVMYFWSINIIYAIIQNIIINLNSGDSTLALLHQNVHSIDYVIPETFIPYLYRVTGLFVESAPFVIYLMFTHFAFLIMSINSKIKFLNLLFIFLSGAKIGLLFLIIYFFFKIPIIRRVNIIYFFFIVCIIFILFFQLFYIFLYQNIDLYLASVFVRLSDTISTFEYFTNSLEFIFFGTGYISSTEILEGVDLGYKRGIDFFSTFIVANGIVGSLLILTPIIIWINKNFDLKEHFNTFFIVLFLSFLSMGSLLNFQYAFLIFILAYNSKNQTKEKK
jgi:hypothetical protein